MNLRVVSRTTLPVQNIVRHAASGLTDLIRSQSWVPVIPGIRTSRMRTSTVDRDRRSSASCRAQSLHNHLPDRRLIVRDEHTEPLRNRRQRQVRRLEGHRRADGKRHRESRSAAALGLHGDRAPVLRHNRLDDRETESRPFARRLRREEWLEDPRKVFRRNPRAVVGHPDRDLRTIRAGIAANRESPATVGRAHRLERVVGEVQDYLLELLLVCGG